jgi:hypothetical protein
MNVIFLFKHFHDHLNKEDSPHIDNIRLFFENYNESLPSEYVKKILNHLLALSHSEDHSLESFKATVTLMSTLKFFYLNAEFEEPEVSEKTEESAYSESENDDTDDSSSEETKTWEEEFQNFKDKILEQYLLFACRFHKNPNFLHKLNNKGVSYEKIDAFLSICLEYDNKKLQGNSMSELVQWFSRRQAFKPFFVFFYDQNISKTQPWITQVIFVHQKTNMFVRISYDDFKFGLFLRDPWTYMNGSLQFIRKRWNEVGK